MMLMNCQINALGITRMSATQCFLNFFKFYFLAQFHQRRCLSIYVVVQFVVVKHDILSRFQKSFFVCLHILVYILILTYPIQSKELCGLFFFHFKHIYYIFLDLN